MVEMINKVDYRDMSRRLGMVIPVWFPPEVENRHIESNLLLSLSGWERYFRANAIVLSVDGCPAAVKVVESLLRDPGSGLPPGCRVVKSEENRGKGHAVALGLRSLLDDTSLDFFAVRDADGDHLLTDLETLYRLGLQVQSETTSEVVIIGRRNSLHAPLGLARAEFELWVDRCLLEALQFGLARAGRVFDRRFCSVYGDAPDFQSGYKLYSRGAAELMAKVVLASGGEWREVFWRGSEIVPLVEAVLAGAVVGEVNRMTLGTQPVSGFSGIYRPRFYGGILAWAFRRLGVEPGQAELIMDNHLAGLKVYWAPEGREELLSARDWVVERLGGRPGGVPPVPEII